MSDRSSLDADGTMPGGKGVRGFRSMISVPKGGGAPLNVSLPSAHARTASTKASLTLHPTKINMLHI